MSTSSYEPLVTQTGCNVKIFAVDEGAPNDGIYLHLQVDTRHAELKMTPSEAYEIGWRLLEQTPHREKETMSTEPITDKPRFVSIDGNLLNIAEIKWVGKRDDQVRVEFRSGGFITFHPNLTLSDVEVAIITALNNQ